MRWYCAIVGVVAIGTLAQAGVREHVRFTPMQPTRGGTVRIIYDPSGTPLSGADSISAEILFLRESDTPLLTTVHLRREDARWSGVLPVPESDVTLLLCQFVAGDLVDDNGEEGWDLMVHTAAGKPVRNAHLARATVLQRSEFYSFKHRRDPEKAQQELNLEQALFPDNWRASVMAWGLMMRSPGGEEAARSIRPQLDSVYEREKEHQSVVAELLPWFEQTGQIDRAESIRSAAIAREPQGQVAMATARSSVFQERDPAARLARIQDVLSRFPWNDRDYDALVGAQVTSLVRLERYEEAAQAATQARHPDGSMYNAIAWPLVEKGEQLEEAVRWARTGVKLSREQSDEQKPEYVSERSWRSTRRMRLGMVLDTYALGLFKLERLREAQRAFEEADSLFDGEVPETAEHLVETYLRNGKPEQALELARRMILTGITSDRTDELYQEAYTRQHGSAEGMEDDLHQLRSAARDRMRTELLKTRVSIPAPAFALKALDGTSVRLEDLRGKVVMIDFWATWCGPCRMSFPFLQRFYDEHRADQSLALFAVNTWERVEGEKRQKTVRKFLADNKYTFPVLFDEAVVEQYGVEGIPTRFVIDQDGIIRFKSIGFEGGDKMLTQMELQLEILLGKGSSASE